MNFWNLRTLFHPTLNSDFTPWSDHWFSKFMFFQTRFFISDLNCKFQFQLRFLHSLPSLTCLQPCHLGSLGVSHQVNQHFLRRECFFWFAVSPNNSAYQTRIQHFVSFSWRVNWKFSSSFATRYVDRVFICAKSGLTIQLYQPFCPPSIVWTGSFSTEQINFLPLDMFRRH